MMLDTQRAPRAAGELIDSAAIIGDLNALADGVFAGKHTGGEFPAEDHEVAG